jgi:hypothetical protein
MSANGWIGVDLDGTLAHYEGWGDGSIGAPIPLMVERVKSWLAQGIQVRIMTARVGMHVEGDTCRRQHDLISLWCAEHLGRALEVTNEKDFGMIELWDDRAISVEAIS